jgi:hypothetical protein
MQTLTRRRFLRWGSAAVVGCAGLWGGVRLIAGRVPEVPNLRVLSARQYATLHAVIRTLYPLGPIVGDALALATEIAKLGDARLAGMPSHIAQQLGVALLYVEAGPVLLERRLQTFSQLDDATRAEHWSRHWEDTDDDLRRGAGIGLRRVIGVWLYDSPSLWPAMHYPGPVLAPIPME